MNDLDQQVRTAVADAWKRIEDWLAEHAPASLAALAGPATTEEIAAVERALGPALPAEFAASLAIHRAVDLNGALADVEHPDLSELPGLRDQEVEDFMWSVDEVHEQIRLGDCWRSGWIPLGREGDGSLFVLDLDPAPAGTHGQVLYAEQGLVPDTVRYAGWLDALRAAATELASGHYHGVDGLIEYRD
ncbi:SMI1/KNR4 family protein [Kitasatospora sp. NPDC059599]|uniref:SMI1/KNR4 family protein n=1 Tax=Kitasatospora sp. NPDC059599 TaxID=3346880 RepID=UPI003693ECC5